MIWECIFLVSFIGSKIYNGIDANIPRTASVPHSTRSRRSDFHTGLVTTGFHAAQTCLQISDGGRKNSFLDQFIYVNIKIEIAILVSWKDAPLVSKSGVACEPGGLVPSWLILVPVT